MLVVIAILGVLMGLLLPALTEHRGPERRTQCINNERQIGLALLGFANAKGCFPNAGTFGESEEAIHSADPARSEIYRAVFHREGADFGLSTTGEAVDGGDLGPRYSWVVDALPYLDIQGIYNDFNRSRPYHDTLSRPGDDKTRPSNRTIGDINIGSLTCPDDDTLIKGLGNLSYVVNGGFSRWHAEGHCYGWSGARSDPALPTPAPSLDWGQDVATRTGVMFLGTSSGKAPWDYRTTLASITDGAGTTLLVTENNLAGATHGTVISGGVTTNWATPHPNFVMFFGSDDVCAKGTAIHPNCSVAGDLSPSGQTVDGTGWKRANRPDSFENINYGRNLTMEGAFPFPNSGHRGGVVATMCDGSTRFINQDIDGAVWAKLLTPRGNTLPPAYRQLPLVPSEAPAR